MNHWSILCWIASVGRFIRLGGWDVHGEVVTLRAAAWHKPTLSSTRLDADRHACDCRFIAWRAGGAGRGAHFSLALRA